MFGWGHAQQALAVESEAHEVHHEHTTPTSPSQFSPPSLLPPPLVLQLVEER